MKFAITFLALGAALAGVVWVYKRWEERQNDEPNDENDNHFLN